MKELIIKIGDEPDATGGYPLAESARELVRCKDCREIYYASNRAPSERAWVCGLHGIDVKPEWYCADGERMGTDA